ncbi:4Fe-4S binding protein [Desulfurivibrio alkaliphilus]|uniref:Polyferredoxin n=1 Tax=Desulfurivibrio alkaliphilus (strain DSM 19089 / UNIQEM U267 / AHT2) TaxID=589865 RepID=D6Z4W4_DESAT|nr:4Fe-4S binding protein [Desulfurivibrio alkaliphilus]ADH86589.1 polyferredoxin [Desulfurivibrio alkaliphilus AHT 2]
MNTAKDNAPKTPGRGIPWTLLRRTVMLAILALFMLQYFEIKLLVGSLSGSTLLGSIKLLDVFAFFEISAAAKGISLTLITAVLPVALLYLVLGRAFCGWVCPMDLLFSLVDKLRPGDQQGPARLPLPPRVGYWLAGGLLLLALLFSLPLFTNYLSHLTNFFRTIAGLVFLAGDLPVEPAMIAWSLLTLLALLVLHYFYPRLWCRVLCPVGKTYGLFNRLSLLKLRFNQGDCEGCELCEHKCYMGVKIVRNLDRGQLRDPNCIYCGRCIEGCRRKGKLIRMSLK